MIKNNKWKLLIGSLAILLPIVYGLLVWEQLPEQMPIHWGADGAADGWTGRLAAVMMVPAIFLALHWLLVWAMAFDKKGLGQNPKMMGVMLWFCPVLSLAVNGIIYSVSLGNELRPFTVIPLVLGAVFVAVGNYLPKCKQNRTVGIKLKWTLENEENWNMTHRFSGKVWVAAGVASACCVFLPEVIAMWVSAAALLMAGVLPVAYSFSYHQKQVKDGTAVFSPVPRTKASALGAVIGVTILVACVGLMFIGDVEVRYQETNFTVGATFWQDLTVDYNAITAIEYRELDNVGTRTTGFASAKLLMGVFHNAEFGNYTRYSYTNNDACVVITGGQKVLVIADRDAESTRAIYDTIKAKMG